MQPKILFKMFICGECSLDKLSEIKLFGCALHSIMHQPFVTIAPSPGNGRDLILRLKFPGITPHCGNSELVKPRQFYPAVWYVLHCTQPRLPSFICMYVKVLTKRLICLAIHRLPSGHGRWEGVVTNDCIISNISIYSL